jgi:hypothetical protein
MVDSTLRMNEEMKLTSTTSGGHYTTELGGEKQV